MYDYLIVGAGFFGSVFAQQAKIANKKVLVIDKRDHIGGNCYTEDIEGIQVHKYGPHIFHTNSNYIWNYITQFAQFNNFVYQPKAYYKGKLYSLPINLNTFYEFFGTITPQEAVRVLENKKIKGGSDNLEDWVLSQVGHEIYDTLIRGYTKKQWGRDPKELPSSIIKRLPLRFTFNNNYFNAKYQGIPIEGYTEIFRRLLYGVELKLSTDFEYDWKKYAKNVIYTGPIDEFYNCRFGPLEYRSLRFENKIYDGDIQGNPVVNYTDEKITYTRVIEHKHFYFLNSPKTVVTKEFPSSDGEKYYPINNDLNNNLYNKYKNLNSEGVLFCGRLGSYKYLDMDQTIAASLKLSSKIL